MARLQNVFLSARVSRQARFCVHGQVSGGCHNSSFAEGSLSSRHWANPCEAGTGFIPILQVGHLRLRKVEPLPKVTQMASGLAGINPGV